MPDPLQEPSWETVGVKKQVPGHSGTQALGGHGQSCPPWTFIVDRNSLKVSIPYSIHGTMYLGSLRRRNRQLRRGGCDCHTLKGIFGGITLNLVTSPLQPVLKVASFRLKSDRVCVCACVCVRSH